MKNMYLSCTTCALRGRARDEIAETLCWAPRAVATLTPEAASNSTRTLTASGNGNVVGRKARDQSRGNGVLRNAGRFH